MTPPPLARGTVPGPLSFPEGCAVQPMRTWYRVMKGGRLWCESSDPAEVAASGGDPATLEISESWQVTLPWQPWDGKKK